MKIAAVCVVVILMGSCRPPISNSGKKDSGSGSSDVAMKRDNEIRKIVDEYWKADNPYYTKHDFEFRGPLTLEQADGELLDLYKKSVTGADDIPDLRSRFARSDLGKAWGEIKGAYTHGDELYFFTSDKRSWAELRGTRGYVLIRKDKVVTMLITEMS